MSADAGSGFDDQSTFTVHAGGTFRYTGAVQHYVVPAGVTRLQVDAVGGSGGDADATVNGAQIMGALPVTPGEILDIGVGGEGHDSDTNYGGGWGLPANGNSFSGGQGVATDVDGGGGGGGASVIAVDGQIQVVAGGGGGEGNNAMHTAAGGQAGYDGQLTGQDGQYGGGQAGSQSTYAGQSATAVDTAVGGAGGGGYLGGAAGFSSNNSGGGAGSSFDAGLNNPSVKTASGNAGDGEIVVVAM